MKKMFLKMVSGLAVWVLLSPFAMAAGVQYQIRVDGLACPYCAYGIEKKFKQIDGVEKVDIDLEKGVVVVDAADDVELSEDRVRTLVNDSGFTYRSITRESR